MCVCVCVCCGGGGGGNRDVLELWWANKAKRPVS